MQPFFRFHRNKVYTWEVCASVKDVIDQNLKGQELRSTLKETPWVIYFWLSRLPSRKWIKDICHFVENEYAFHILTFYLCFFLSFARRQLLWTYKCYCYLVWTSRCNLPWKRGCSEVVSYSSKIIYLLPQH